MRVESGRGELSHVASRKVLDDLKKRAPETNTLERHVAVEEALAGNPLSLDNLALPLEDGKEAYASMLKAIFARDLAESEPITPETWRRRPILDRVKEAGARSLSELL